MRIANCDDEKRICTILAEKWMEKTETEILNFPLIFRGGVAVLRAQETPKTITGLGAGAITGPVTPNGISKWDIVEFGSYPQDSDGNGGFVDAPIKWRVLSKDGDDFFLLADKALDCKKYNEVRNDVTWETCTLRKWLNNDADGFYNTAFTEDEKKAIVMSEVDNPGVGDTSGGNPTRDKVYLLSWLEARNPDYGFNYSISPGSPDAARIALATDYAKSQNASTNSNKQCDWWLRSPGGYGSDYASGVVSNGSGFDGDLVDYDEVSVRPALHINLKSIIAVTEVERGGEGDSFKSKYRLTFRDEKLGIETGTVERKENEITVPYTVTGDNKANATQASVLLLNYESGNNLSTPSSDLPTFTYAVLDTGNGDFTTSGSGKFELPAAYRGKKCGTDYYAYIMAEDVNAVSPAVDMASTPVSFNIPEHYVTNTSNGYTPGGTTPGGSTAGSTPGGGSGATDTKENPAVSGNTSVSDNKVTSGNAVTSGNTATSGNSADSGAPEKETVKNPDGTVTVTEKTTASDGTVTTVSATLDAKGNVTTISIEKKTDKVTETETFAVKNRKKNTVVLVKASTNAKTGEVTIPKTVTSDGKTYKVTVLKKGMLKGGKKKAKAVTVDASAIKKVEAGAFDGMAKKGKITLNGTKKQCKKLEKKIRKSGLPKGVTVERAKKSKKK